MGKTATLANIGSVADSSLGFRNRIINGAMTIDQRNAGASINIGTSIATSQYTLDRWNFDVSQAPKISAQQSTNAPAGFSNSLLVTSLAATTVGAADYFQVNQKIEGFNTADFGFGAAGASITTLSFWVKSTLTGSFSGTLKNSAANRSYPFSYTINAANTWEQKTITVAGDTSGTWVGSTNGSGLNVNFSLGMGSTYSGSANAWATANLGGVTGSVNMVATNAATWQITGVQLEKGATATSFDYRDYGRELIMCQRYYTQFGKEQTYTPLASLGVSYNATNTLTPLILPVEMRTYPTFIVSTAEVVEWQTTNSWPVTTYATPSEQSGMQTQLINIGIGSSSFTAGRVTSIRTTSTAGYIGFSAEL